MEALAPNSQPPIHSIVCCMCGAATEPNNLNMCIGCIRTQFDITEGVPKQASIYFCSGCERYLHPPVEWVKCSLESKELLTLCLKKLKGLNKLKLIDACFLWTEPHSKRIKVKLTVQQEVVGQAILQQEFVVEYVVTHQMCNDCHRMEAQNFWRASVQIRQKCENKKTLYYLEQLILKHNAHNDCVGIKSVIGGLDFFFAKEAQAKKMVDFVSSVLPCKFQHSKKLISHDIHSNIYNYKFTFSVELVPISKDSIVCIPKKLKNELAGISQICLVYKVSRSLHLMDTSTAQISEVSNNVFWRTPFSCICNPKQLIEFIVINIEPIVGKDRQSFPGQGSISSKHVIADVWVTKACNLGITNDEIHTRTHLGHVLKAGDSVLGYSLVDMNTNNSDFDKIDSSLIPDVILVKKFYADKSYRARIRNWKLKHLVPELHDQVDHDMDDFMNDLEEDSALRQGVNIFKSSHNERKEEIDPSIPTVPLEEMLEEFEDMHIDDE